MIRSKIYRALLKEVSTARLSPPNKLNKELISREKGRLDLFMGRKKKTTGMAKPLRPITESEFNGAEEGESFMKRYLGMNVNPAALDDGVIAVKKQFGGKQDDNGQPKPRKLRVRNGIVRMSAGKQKANLFESVEDTTEGGKFLGAKKYGEMRRAWADKTQNNPNNKNSQKMKAHLKRTNDEEEAARAKPSVPSTTEQKEKFNQDLAAKYAAAKDLAEKTKAKLAEPKQAPKSPIQTARVIYRNPKLAINRLRRPGKFTGINTGGKQYEYANMRTAKRNIPIKIPLHLRASETPFILFRLLEGPAAKTASKAAPKKAVSKAAPKPAANKLPGKAAVMPPMQPPAPPQPNPNSSPDVKLLRKKAKDAVTSGKVKHAAPEAKKPAIKLEKFMSESAGKEKVEMTKPEFKKEHKHLFRVLKGCKNKECKKELHKQKKEFKKEVKESGNPVNKMAAKAVKVWQGGGIPLNSKVGKAAIDFKMGKQSRRFLRRNKSVLKKKYQPWSSQN